MKGKINSILNYTYICCIYVVIFNKTKQYNKYMNWQKLIRSRRSVCMMCYVEMVLYNTWEINDALIK